MPSLKRYVISAHPYLFDAFFRALRWCGSGQVTLLEIAGGVSQARAVAAADDAGYLALKAAGFAVEQFGQKYDRAAAL